MRFCISPYFSDACREMRRSSVIKIVSRHGRNHHKRKSELRNCISDTDRLAMIGRQRLTMPYCAVAAASRAAVAEDEKRRTSAAEAFPDIGTLRLETYRVHRNGRSFQAHIVLSAGDFHLYPFRDPSVHCSSSRSGLTLHSIHHINLEYAPPQS